MVLRSACSGGGWRHPEHSKSKADNAAHSHAGRGLPAHGACAPIEVMNIERPWLASYPATVPTTINLAEFPSIVSVLAQSCERFRDNPAFSNFGKTLTYEEVDLLSARFASYLLHELKLKKGDRVALMMPNLLQYPVAIFGVLQIGRAHV